MGERYDSPNQQVVRADGSGASDEGTGGEQAAPPESPKTEPDDELESMTKAELVAYADEAGIEVNEYANKDEIKAAIRAGVG